MVDPNEFFREITLRLCSHLALEQGLRSCIEYLAKHMPADVVYLEQFDHDARAMRILARATADSCEKMDKTVPLTTEAAAAMDHLRQAFDAGHLPEVLIINRPDEDPVTRLLSSALGDPHASVMALPLVVEGTPLGTLTLLAQGIDRFTETHAGLYGLLREPFFVAMSNALKMNEVIRFKDFLADDNRFLRKELHEAAGKDIIGEDLGLRKVMHLVSQVSAVDSPVLLLGETGVGKDVIANAVHYSSARRNGPFIKVNSGAIPDTLLDSELFGHEKGAFTGALSVKRGRFERAHGGTIFLDEIGELPPPAQVRLLRVLQEKEIERVGAVKTIKVDIRIIAATNKNLSDMVKAGTFRKDLWFRLNVFPIHIPPLRERREDIAALTRHFVLRKSEAMRLSVVPSLTPGAFEALQAYPWPGNVRELENVVERALILNPDGPLDFNSLLATEPVESSLASENQTNDLNLDATVTRHIRRVLTLTGGQIHGKGGAAEKLGVNPNTLRSRMKKLGIPVKS